MGADWLVYATMNGIGQMVVACEEEFRDMTQYCVCGGRITLAAGVTRLNRFVT